VKIHKSKHLYNETLPFLPWLFTITKNALIDEVRKGEKEKNHLSVDAVTLISPEAEATPQLSEVLPYLKTLPENQKRVVEMRYIEEKTFEEISLALETSPMNVRKLLSRGVQRLKELLKEGDKP
jgi:RNA polymerase sigma factor (sigma-70 family)